MNQNPSSPPAIIKAASAAVWKQGRVLLIERGQPPGQGFWAVPGGKCKAGETEIAAAAREVLEETGVVARLEHPLGIFPVRRETYAFDIHCFAGHWVSGEPRVTAEAKSVRWVTVEEAKALNLAPNVLDAISLAAKLLHH